MKKATRRPLDSEMRVDANVCGWRLLQSFFREAGASSRALAGLELRIGFANDVNRSFAFHDLAISVTAFCGGE